jgi:hypothetical protein
MSSKVAREDAKYGTLPETASVDVSDGYVTLSRIFKYLGLTIPYSLRDDDNIDAHLATASKSMGVLNKVWRNPRLDTYSKCLLVRAIPLDLLLWRCEN